MATSDPPRVVVLGSVHMDLIASAASLPKMGLSVQATGFSMAPGGKAANQACQISQEGCAVSIITKLGRDPFGQTLAAALTGRGIDVSQVTHDRKVPTGASTVFAINGEYASIIAPGAAAQLTVAEINARGAKIGEAMALVLQLELPVALSLHAAEIACAAGVMVVVNASPPPVELPPVEPLLRLADVLVVNASEAHVLLGHHALSAPRAAQALADKYAPSTVVVTSGKTGSDALHEGRFYRQAALPGDVVDSIGAGDAYLGALVASLLRGTEMQSAMRRASAAAVLVVGRSGAFDAIPSSREIDVYLNMLGSATRHTQ